MDMEKLIKKLGLISGGKILDVASGRGEFIGILMQVLKDYEKFIGIDFSDKTVKFSQKHFKDKPVEIIKMNAENMSFADASFDVVGIQNSLHHMLKLDKVLNEMKRVLKPGGYFLICEMHCEEGQTPAQQNHIKIHHWCAEIDTILSIPHKKTFKREQIKKIVENLGLTKLHTFEYSYPMENPKDEEFIERLKKTITSYVERIRDHEDYERLKAKGEELKKSLKTFGYAPAATLFFIGNK